MCMFHSVLGLRQPRIVRAWNFTGGVRLGLTPCHSSVGFAPALSGSHMNPAYSCRSLSALLLAALVAGCISGEPAQKPPGESSNVGGNGSGSTGTAPEIAGGGAASNAGGLSVGGTPTTGVAQVVPTGGRSVTATALFNTGGTLVSSTGGLASFGTGGAGPSGTQGCDFTSTACSSPCATLPAWETTACSGLLTCLAKNPSCITKDDSLCATSAQYGNPVCTDVYQLSDASKTTVCSYVSCVCGL